MNKNIRCNTILNRAVVMEENMTEVRRDFCTTCRKQTEYTLQKRNITKMIKEKEYTFSITVAICKECGEEMSIPGLIDKNIHEMDEQYRTYENIVSSFESCKENITSLVNLYCDYKNLLDEKKRELGAFDFSDLETFCAKILENDEICNEIKNGYEKIFVDEFQDINPMQYAILKKISKNNQNQTKITKTKRKNFTATYRWSFFYIIFGRVE